MQTQLRSFIEAYPFPSLAINAHDFTLTGINRAGLNIFNAKEKELAGRNLFQLFTPDEEQLRPIVNSVRETKKSCITDIPMQDLVSVGERATQERRSVLVLTPVVNDDQEANLIICSFLPASSQENEELQALKENQSLLDKAYPLAQIGVWKFDMQTHDLYWSDVTKELHGFGPEYQPEVESTIDLFKEGENREQFAEVVQAAIEDEQPFDVELKIVSGQGDERWIRATGEPEYVDGICMYFYGISQNVTDRRKAEEDLFLKEQRFRSLVQDGSDMLAILDGKANYKYVSPTSESILGIPADNLIHTNALEYIHPDDHPRVIEILEDLKPGMRRNIAPFRFQNADGEWRWVETTLTNLMKDPAVDGIVANARDVTEQKEQQQKMTQALREKETLLAEIHHRVKNNLAVVSGMMQLQVADTEDPELAAKLNDSIIRIRTMAGIHEQLYQANSFSELEFADNIHSLISSIHTALHSDTQVQIEFDCDPVHLNINQAIPCSLIVNEVATNIFKHAFPDRNEGHISVELKETGDEQIHLCIKDNGIGLPEDFSKNSGSLGMSLINVLSKQLESDYRFESDEEGTVFHLHFTKDNQKGTGNSLL